MRTESQTNFSSQDEKELTAEGPQEHLQREAPPESPDPDEPSVAELKHSDELGVAESLNSVRETISHQPEPTPEHTQTPELRKVENDCLDLLQMAREYYLGTSSPTKEDYRNLNRQQIEALSDYLFEYNFNRLKRIKSDYLSGDTKVLEDNQVKLIHEGDRDFFVGYVSPDLEPFFLGHALLDSDLAYVRNDLPPKVTSFVTAHEIGHCKDKTKNGSYFGDEFRATFVPMLKDPAGFVATVTKQISNANDGEPVTLKGLLKYAKRMFRAISSNGETVYDKGKE